jgi:predicted DNA-binding protein (UPF0251 family)
MKIEIRTHYPEGEMYSDYAEVSVHIDGIEVIRYGDWYHDKGAEKASAFVDGVKHIVKDVEVSKAAVDDYQSF